MKKYHQNKKPHYASKPPAARERTPRADEHEGSGRYVIGRNAVFELLKIAPDKIITLLFATRQEEDSRRHEIRDYALGCGVEIQERSQHELTKIVGSDSHQGIAALLPAGEGVELSALLRRDEDEPSLIILLDDIQDPHNLGAIFRAAACFGVHGIVWSKNRGASITPAVTKVSVGATEIVPYARVSNLADAARKCREAGYWLVGAEAQGASVSTFDKPKKIALVLGSEGEGIHHGIKSMLDFSVSVPIQGPLDSLNVSQAAAVLLFALNR